MFSSSYCLDELRPLRYTEVTKRTEDRLYHTVHVDKSPKNEKLDTNQIQKLVVAWEDAVNAGNEAAKGRAKELGDMRQEKQRNENLLRDQERELELKKFKNKDHIPERDTRKDVYVFCLPGQFLMFLGVPN